MLGMKRPVQIRSVIGTELRVQGACAFRGGLQVDGQVVGDVMAEGGAPSALVVGASGRIEGAVRADEVSVAGTIVGPVQARERLELLAGARIEGDVRYKMLEMQPGAVVVGQLQPQPIAPQAPEPVLLAESPTLPPGAAETPGVEDVERAP